MNIKKEKEILGRLNHAAQFLLRPRYKSVSVSFGAKSLTQLEVNIKLSRKKGWDILDMSTTEIVNSFFGALGIVSHDDTLFLKEPVYRQGETVIIESDSRMRVQIVYLCAFSDKRDDIFRYLDRMLP